jgi:hypothetical protein
MPSSLAVREHKPGMEWKTPERSKIRGWRADGKKLGLDRGIKGLTNRRLSRT